MKRIVGVAAFLLGSVGVALCVAGLAVTWVAAARLREVTDRTQTAVDCGLAAIDESLERVSGELDGSRSTTGSIMSATRLSGDKTADVKEDFAAAFNRLTPVVERADGLAESLRSISDLLNRTAEAVEQLGGSHDTPRRLREVADELAAVCGRLAAVRDEVEAIQGGQGQLSGERVRALASRVDEQLNRLSDRVSDVRGLVNDGRAQANACGDKVRFWTLSGSIAATAGFVWIGLGQLCLVLWGRRFPSPPAAST
jgi:ElaB/YqjD/DUF883 family membrane-anchored ribosome-binding protein/uncharacterized protein YoxC